MYGTFRRLSMTVKRHIGPSDGEPAQAGEYVVIECRGVVCRMVITRATGKQAKVRIDAPEEFRISREPAGDWQPRKPRRKAGRR